MFRPNRIGTPYTYSENDNPITTDYTPAEQDPVGNAAHIVNAIHGTPMLDFGRVNIYLARTETYTALRRSGFGAQLTITPPKNADTVGLELSGSIVTLIPSDASIIPYFGKAVSAAGLLAALSLTGQPQLFDAEQPPLITTPTHTPRCTSFKQQVIIRDTTKNFGLYSAGFLIYTGTTGWSFNYAQIQIAVRQLNDQSGVNYLNTLK